MFRFGGVVIAWLGLFIAFLPAGWVLLYGEYQFLWALLMTVPIGLIFVLVGVYMWTEVA